MPGTAAKILLGAVQMKILESMVTSRTVAVRLAQRAQIVLLGFDKKNNEFISEIVGLNPQQVGLWRRRWKARFDELVEVECNQTRAALERAVAKVPSDQPRKGRGSTFSTEQQAAIVAIACEAPDSESDRPSATWTAAEIADEAVNVTLSIPFQRPALGVLRRKLIRHGAFKSVNDLNQRILKFIDYYNQNSAHPYRWACDCALLCK